MAFLAGENKRYERKAYDPKEDTFAVITPEQKKLGRVKKVDSKGITFHYIDESHNQSPLEEVKNSIHKVDIFIKQRGYYLRDLPIKSHADSTANDTPTFSLLPMRKIIIEFGELNSAQIRKLEFLSSQYDAY